MRTMTNFTLKSLRANKVRSLVTICGVMLAAALLTAVLTCYVSLTGFLYKVEVSVSGTWMASVEVENPEDMATEIIGAQEDPIVTGMASLSDVGFAELSAKEQKKLGKYMTIVSADGDYSKIVGVNPSEGRLPENSNEILLFSSWNTNYGVNLGDEITYKVGNRYAIAADEGDHEMTVYKDAYYSDEEDGSRIVDGSKLGSSIGYLDADSDGGYFYEELRDISEKTYTVVGFYDRLSNGMVQSLGPSALTVGDKESGVFSEIYLTFSDMKNAEEVKETAQGLFPDSGITLHDSLLRFMGLSSETSIWSTFYGLIVILSAVIAVACISLIFNAFNISVAQRMTQFGLLSSIGATRRQLRRAVILEATLIAIIGIPLGVLVGIGGCAATFAIFGDAIAEVAGEPEFSFDLIVDVPTLLFAMALTYLTVLISAWIPAMRASRINVIDALKNKGASRVTVKGASLALKGARDENLWKERGVLSKAFGAGGMLALINRKRSTAKGRAASVSLALAIVLLLSAGSLNVFLGTLVGAVSEDASHLSDVTATAMFERQVDDGAKESGSSKSKDAAAPKTEKGASASSAQALLDSANDHLAVEEGYYQGAYDMLCEAPESIARGWSMSSSEVLVSIPSDMAGSYLADNEILSNGLKVGESQILEYASLYYIDDRSFDEYARSIGEDPSIYYDSRSPKAIGVSMAYGNDGTAYKLCEMLESPGDISVISMATYEGSQVDIGVTYTGDLDDGQPEISCGYVPSNDEDASTIEVDPAEIDLLEETLTVEAINESAPDFLSSPGESVMLVVPMSLARSKSFGIETPLFTANFDAADGDSVTLTGNLFDIVEKYFDSCPLEVAFRSCVDNATSLDSVHMLATIVNVFCLLFTVILALIALANVFNSVTNNLILRRREFAVMRSIGLSNSQFRKMICYECMNFGLAGLVPGLLISVVVSFLLWYAVSASITGVAFAVPWTYLALAIAMTAVAMAVSVAYGMRRCSADNVVEALRSESI